MLCKILNLILSSALLQGSNPVARSILHVFRLFQLLSQELDWHDHNQRVLSMFHSVLECAAKTKLEHILIGGDSRLRLPTEATSSLVSQVPLRIARFTVVGGQVHQALINELLQDLKLNFVELERFSIKCLARVNCEINILLRFRVAPVPQGHRASHFAAA